MEDTISNFNGIHHIALATNDMDKTIRFWRDFLKLKIVLTSGKPGEKQYFFELSKNNMIAFFEWPNINKFPYKRHGEKSDKPFIFDHLSIGVNSYKELTELQDRLIEAEMPVSNIIDHGFIYSIYSYDPNAIPIEFTYSKESINIRENPVMGDPNPSGITLEGNVPQNNMWPTPEYSYNEEDHPIIKGEGSELFSKNKTK